MYTCLTKTVFRKLKMPTRMTFYVAQDCTNPPNNRQPIRTSRIEFEDSLQSEPWTCRRAIEPTTVTLPVGLPSKMIRRIPVACRGWIFQETKFSNAKSSWNQLNRPRVVVGSNLNLHLHLHLRLLQHLHLRPCMTTNRCLSSEGVATTSSTGAASTPAATLKPPAHSNQNNNSCYNVARVGLDGSISLDTLQISEIRKSSPSIYARDLFSLSLTSKQERDQYRKGAPRRTVSAILPRGDKLLVSFGSLRAMIAMDFVLIFDAHSKHARHFARDVARTFEQKSTEQLSGDNDKPKNFQYADEPFELIILEEILQDTCDGFHRRIRLYEPIVESFLNRVSNEIFSDSGVHLLPPLKDSLQSFEMQVVQSRDCLTELLGNDDDMLGLLVTEQHDARAKGMELLASRHEDVELLLEEYARQLNTTLFDIQFLLKRLQSKQEFVQLALSGYRNRLIRMNLYLGIAGLTFGIGTTVAGFFGMNLINGLEDNPYVFNAVVTSTAVVGIAVFGGCMSYVSGKNMQKRAAQRLFEIETLNSALSDMGALDFTVKRMLDKGETMSRDDFREKLKKARLSGEVTDAEVELLFGSMDAQKDGVLKNDDFLELGKLMISKDKKRWRIP